MAGSQEAPGTCCICLDGLKVPSVSDQRLPFGHDMHERCITEMCRRGASMRCPVCRAAHPDDLMMVQDMMDQAIQYFLHGSYEECRQWASRACDTDPDSAVATRSLGDLYFEFLGQRDISRAKAYYEVAHGKGVVDAMYSTTLESCANTRAPGHSMRRPMVRGTWRPQSTSRAWCGGGGGAPVHRWVAERLQRRRCVARHA